MRIISQDKTIDVPYDNVVLTIEPTSFKGSDDVVKDIYDSFNNKKYYTM